MGEDTRGLPGRTRSCRRNRDDTYRGKLAAPPNPLRQLSPRRKGSPAEWGAAQNGNARDVRFRKNPGHGRSVLRPDSEGSAGGNFSSYQQPSGTRTGNRRGFGRQASLESSDFGRAGGNQIWRLDGSGTCRAREGPALAPLEFFPERNSSAKRRVDGGGASAGRAGNGGIAEQASGPMRGARDTWRHHKGCDRLFYGRAAGSFPAN